MKKLNTLLRTVTSPLPLIVILILLFLVSSCKPRLLLSDKEESFIQILGADNINSSIVMQSDPRLGDGKVAVINQSSQEIRFNYNLDFRIYSYEEEQQAWIEIKDKGEYVNEGQQILEPRTVDKDFPPFLILSFWPDIAPNRLPVTLRITFTGQMINGKSEKVAAFTDVIYSGK